jgi:single-stranded-DNA-specific exonuclease
LRKKWEIAPRMPAAHAERNPKLPALLLQLLYNRDIADPSEIRDFIGGSWQEPDLYLLPDMERAVDVLIRAISRQEKIAVYGDFDADGVTATALLTQVLDGLGANVIHYIPPRADGYGVNIKALRELYRQEVRLVVTVDCGVRAVDEIEQARRGLEFVVTDHHDLARNLPFASAVINPKRRDSTYPFSGLAGVGVAYKLAQALIREAVRRGMPADVEEGALLDLVALGTVADLAPLLGENRYLVQRGLEVINDARREGVRALLQVSGLRPGAVTASSIAFALGPRLNAAGRLGDASLSYELLVATDPVQADRLAARLNEQNRQRRNLTEHAYQLAEELALAPGEMPNLLFAAHPDFSAGVVGLVAGRLTEAHYRPAVVVEQAGEISRGSCRSIPEFDITAALDECSDLLLRHGGHATAAGFRIHSDQLGTLVQRLSEIAQRELSDLALVPALSIDAEVDVNEMSWETMSWLEKLEPCGYRNPAPLFLSRGVPLAEARAVGSEGKHLKLTLAAETEAREAIAFRLGDRVGEVGARMDLVYQLEVNEWNGSRSLQLNVQDFGPSNS